MCILCIKLINDLTARTLKRYTVLDVKYTKIYSKVNSAVKTWLRSNHRMCKDVQQLSNEHTACEDSGAKNTIRSDRIER